MSVTFFSLIALFKQTLDPKALIIWSLIENRESFSGTAVDKLLEIHKLDAVKRC